MSGSYWVPHGEHAWVARALKSNDKEKAVFETEVFVPYKSGKKQRVEALELPSAKFKNLHEVLPEHHQGVLDVCNLTSVSEGALLNTVWVRYVKDEIYTRVSRTIISVNPYKNLEIFDQGHTEKYKCCLDSMDLPPHIFGLAQDALNYLMQGMKGGGVKKHQAILISGESGAGKSEAAKYILRYTGDAVGHSKGGLEDKVLKSNQVLEAYGNAKTTRNNNSSRYGKWMDLRFAETSGKVSMLGCCITSYLLETTRICQQQTGEACFHIFRIMLQAKKDPDIQNLHLQEGSYKYVQGGLEEPSPVTLEELCSGFDALEIRGNLREQVFKITAGVLELGNVVFKDGQAFDSSDVEDREQVKKIADLLAVDEDNLTICMTKRLIGAHNRQSAAMAINTPKQAALARDSMAQFIYEKLFLWIIRRINLLLVHSPEHAEPNAQLESLLGVLDIAGFESFEKNSLEQLQINLSNEHLQQHFNNVIFKAEQREAEEEGIPPPQVSFADNKEVLALIDERNGLMDILDDVGSVQTNTDDAYFARLQKQQQPPIPGSSQFEVPKFQKTKGALSFEITHFAGIVTYDLHGWLEKNAKKVPEMMPSMLAGSELTVLQELAEDPAAPAQATDSKKKKTKQSMTRAFRNSLKELIAKIHERQSHFIRCIKPNMAKKQGIFEGAKVMEQLLFSGVLATVHIRQQGFAYRIPLQEFKEKYYVIMRRATGSIDNVRRCVDRLPQFLLEQGMTPEITKDQLALGKTKVFMKTNVFRAVEDFLHQVMDKVQTDVAKRFRGFKARKEFKPKLDLVQAIRALLTQHRLGAYSAQPASDIRTSRRGTEFSAQHLTAEDFEGIAAKLSDLLDQAKKEEVEFHNVAKEAECVRQRMKEEQDAMYEMRGALASNDLQRMQKAIAEASRLHLPVQGDVLELQKAVDELKRQTDVQRNAIAEIRRLVSVHDSALDVSEVEANISRAEAALAKARKVGLPEKGDVCRLIDKIERMKQSALELAIEENEPTDESEEGENEDEEEQSEEESLGDTERRNQLQGPSDDLPAIISHCKRKLLCGGSGGKMPAAQPRRKASIGILGGDGAKRGTHKLVAQIGQLMSSDAELVSEAAFFTGGAPGVQQIFVKNCSSEALIYNLLPDRQKRSNYEGQDKQDRHFDAKLRKHLDASFGSEPADTALGLLADIYIVASDVTREERAKLYRLLANALSRGAIVVPLMRTFRGSAAGIPKAAKVRPDFVGEGDWNMLSDNEMPQEETAQAVVRIAKLILKEKDDLRRASLNCKPEDSTSGRELLQKLKEVTNSGDPKAISDLVQQCEKRRLVSVAIDSESIDEDDADDDEEGGGACRLESVNNDEEPEDIVERARHRCQQALDSEWKAKKPMFSTMRKRWWTKEAKQFQYQMEPITKSMTLPPRDLDENDQNEYTDLAVENYKHILAIMEQNPRARSNPQASFKALRDTMRFPDMQTECYMQVIKQVTKCPRKKILKQGWQLLLGMCSEFPPPSEVADFMYEHFKNEPDRLQQIGSTAASLANAVLLLVSPAEPEELLGVEEKIHSSCASHYVGPNVQSVGFSLVFVPGKLPVVKEVTKNSWAFMNGLQPGDVIAHLNDNDTRSLADEGELMQQMRRRPLRFTVNVELSNRSLVRQEEPPERSSPSASPRISRGMGLAMLHAGAEVTTLGFNVRIRRGQAPVVAQVDQGSWADQQNVKRGDVIVKLNEMDSSPLTEPEFIAEMGKRPLFLAVAAESAGRDSFWEPQDARATSSNAGSPASVPPDADGRYKMMRAGKGVKELGFSLQYFNDRPPVVMRVVPQGWADKQGIQIGDIIALLNNVDYRMLGEREFKMFMRERPVDFAISKVSKDVSKQHATPSMRRPARSPRMQKSPRRPQSSQGSPQASLSPRQLPSSMVLSTSAAGRPSCEPEARRSGCMPRPSAASRRMPMNPHR